VDLSDAAADAGVRRMLRLDRPTALAVAKADEAILTRVLASVKGVTVKIAPPQQATAPAIATATVDFGVSPAPLAEVAKPLCLELMSEHGVSIPDSRQWEFSVSGTSIVATGGVSDDGLRRLVGMLYAAPPSVAIDADARPAAAKTSGDAANPQQAEAEASKKYYKSVSTVLDTFKPGASLADDAGWLSRAARQIDQTATLNVDPDLIAWGAGVSASLREASGIYAAGQQKVRARADSVQSPVVYSGSKYDDNQGQMAAQARADLENARRQRQQASGEARAQVSEAASKPLQDALNSRGKIKAEMAKRYGGGF
jgi:hypothetical protein